MSNLSQKTQETIKKYLLRQQKQVEKDLKTVEGDDPATTPSLAESSEPGTDSWMAETHTRIMVLGDQLKKTGINIRKALSKIRDGSYGRCESCKKQIETSRLLAIPTTTLCLSCSKKK